MWEGSLVLMAALRDLQWRRRRFVIAILGTAVVFAMTLVLTGLANGFRVESRRALGADAAQVAAVQAKSHVSFKAGFEQITTRSVVAETGGPTTGDLKRLPYARRPRPLYPFEDA